MPKKSLVRPIALTVAGSDPGGGAGVQADLKTFAALGVYGYSALTAVIAQNSARITRLAPVAPAMVSAQIEAIAAERKPAAVKTGALANAAIVREAGRTLEALGLPAPVVDPVMISSSGSRLLDRAGAAALRTRLFPISRVVTPNVPEAQALSGIEIDGVEAMREAARRIVRLGARAVVVKGGHLAAGLDAIDLLYDGGGFVMLRAPRLAPGNAHGTGCAFSAAIAAYLARGADLEGAVRGAKKFVTAALERSFTLGRGGRPLLDHFAHGIARYPRRTSERTS
jgi:hydroxymethylpyrimidine kinase/phosphomethylpyrimidine kinase